MWEIKGLIMDKYDNIANVLIGKDGNRVAFYVPVDDRFLKSTAHTGDLGNDVDFFLESWRKSLAGFLRDNLGGRSEDNRDKR
jgi:hypothetical protein